jgi:hypothetical protein
VVLALSFSGSGRRLDLIFMVFTASADWCRWCCRSGRPASTGRCVLRPLRLLDQAAPRGIRCAAPRR